MTIKSILFVLSFACFATSFSQINPALLSPSYIDLRCEKDKSQNRNFYTIGNGSKLIKVEDTYVAFYSWKKENIAYKIGADFNITKSKPLFDKKREVFHDAFTFNDKIILVTNKSAKQLNFRLFNPVTLSIESKEALFSIQTMFTESEFSTIEVTPTQKTSYMSYAKSENGKYFATHAMKGTKSEFKVYDKNLRLVLEYTEKMNVGHPVKRSHFMVKNNGEINYLGQKPTNLNFNTISLDGKSSSTQILENHVKEFVSYSMYRMTIMNNEVYVSGIYLSDKSLGLISGVSGNINFFMAKISESKSIKRFHDNDLVSTLTKGGVRLPGKKSSFSVQELISTDKRVILSIKINDQRNENNSVLSFLNFDLEKEQLSITFTDKNLEEIGNQFVMTNNSMGYLTFNKGEITFVEIPEKGAPVMKKLENPELLKYETIEIERTEVIDGAIIFKTRDGRIIIYK